MPRHREPYTVLFCFLFCFVFFFKFLFLPLEEHEDTMERLVSREMFARRLLLTLFMLVWSGCFIACNHALVWGKDDPEGKVKNARVSSTFVTPRLDWSEY